MKQVVRKGLKHIIVDEVADPVPGNGQVVVRPFYSLISSGTETADIHTDSLVKEVADNPSHLSTVWNIMKKTDPVATVNEVVAKFSEYAVLGYSGAGVIVEKHDSVTDLLVGQRVAYGGEGTGHGESICVGRNLVARVPDNVEFQDACFTTLGSIAMNAVRQAQLQIGETVVVVGLGLVGQLVAQLARCQGAIVIATDLHESRIDLASKTGADHGVKAGEIEQIDSLTGGKGADCVIVAAASSSSTPVQQAAVMCRERGRIVVVGGCPLDLNRDLMYIKDLKLLMARAYGPGSYDPVYEKQGVDYPFPYVRWTENRNMEEFLRLVSKEKIDTRSLVTHEFELDDAAEGYKTIMEKPDECLAVLLRYPSNDAVDVVAEYQPKRRIELITNSEPVDKETLQFGLIGAGNLAKWAHLPALKKLTGASLKAVYSSSGARGKSYGMRFGAEYSCSDKQEILNDPDIDVVLISSASHHHAAETIGALEAGKHVFVEKPMAVSIKECQDIYKAARKSGKQVCVGFNRRFAPYYLDIKKGLGRSAGKMVVTTRMNSGLKGDFWGGDPKYGGATVGEGCHFIDLMYWLTESEPVSVMAHSFPMGNEEPLGINNISASIEFENGSIGNFLYTTVGSEASQGELVEVFADGFGATTEDFKRLVLKGDAEKRRSRKFAAKGYDLQMKQFVADIRNGRNTAVSVIDGARATIVCLKIIESAERGERVEINLEEILEG